MHITGSLSPASGEMLDGNVINLYGNGVEDCGVNFAVDHTVPESSHTVEIEYIYEDAQSEIPKAKKPKHKTEKMVVEDQETDLTNLNWLQNITNIMSVPQFPLPPMSPNPQTKSAPQNTRLQKFNQTLANCQKDFTENKEEYRNNGQKKPPYSYNTLICMAMRYNNDKMTLSAIYSWIRDNFRYYRNADPTWQNSIRHNLSLSKVFVKEARSKQEPGKGGFWKLDFTHLEGSRTLTTRPSSKRKNANKNAVEKISEEKIAVANIPQIEVQEPITLHLPEFSVLPTSQNQVGANVIVEPVPSLIQEEDLTSLLLDPTEWDDLQLDMLDNYLDSCFT